jgi:hypothetical protein
MTDTATEAKQRNRLRAAAHRHRRTLGIAGAGASAGLTALWTIVAPEKADATGGVQEFAIRWGHPACWALLTVVGLLVAFDAPKHVRDAVAYAAGACYVVFLVATLL